MKDRIISFGLFLSILAMAIIKNNIDNVGLINIFNVLLWVFAVILFIGSLLSSDKVNNNMTMADKIVGRTIYFSTALLLIYYNDIALGTTYLLAGLFMYLKGSSNAK